MRRLAVLFIALLGVVQAQELTIHFVDVGQGDGVWIQSPSGQNVVYDGGRSSETMLNYLETHGVKSVDLVIASHPDADHIGGLAAVVAHYRPRFFMDDGIPHGTKSYTHLLETVKETGSQLLEPTARQISLGPVTLQIIPPPGKQNWDTNDNSIGLVVSYGSFRAAMTGDSTPREFAWWLRNYPSLLVPVQVYKSAHHGSAHNDTPTTMNTWQPQVVVISVGNPNPYGHPTEHALNLYRQEGAKIYRTDEQGTITVTAGQDGAYTISTTKRAASETAGQASSPSPPSSPLQQTGQVPAGSVSIRCILYNPPGSNDGNEVVTLTANTSVDVSGWTLRDAAGHVFNLPNTTLTAGQTTEIPNPGSPVWNNGGDTAYLYNSSGGLVDSFNYVGGGSQACR